MSKKTIYICWDDSFQCTNGMPCTIVNRKAGEGKAYVEIKPLFGELDGDRNHHFTFPKYVKKAPPALVDALYRAMEIYKVHSKLKDL